MFAAFKAGDYDVGLSFLLCSYAAVVAGDHEVFAVFADLASVSLR